MLMVMWRHLTRQHTLIALELNVKNVIGNRNIAANIFRIQAYNSIMCRYFGIGFIDFMLDGKHLLEYTNLFYPTEYKNNDRIMLKYFQ